MKFSCTQENLNNNLLIVNNIASKTTNLPILNNVLIEAKGGQIKMVTTNLEVGITCWMRGRVDQEGEFTIPARLITEYVSLLPKGIIDLELKDDFLTIKTENSKSKIKGEPVSEFPVLPVVEKRGHFKVSTQRFIDGISQTIFAVSLNESRPEISGVLFKADSKNQLMFMTSTDSYRLAEKKINLLESKDLQDFEVIIPAKSLQELLRILNSLNRVFLESPEQKDLESTLDIFITDGQALFTSESFEFISRLVEGKYPDYQQIIPDKLKTEVILNRADLINVIKTTSLFTRAGINDVSLEFKPDNKEIIASSINNQLGENVTNIGANITGEDCNIVVNYRYLLDGLNNMPTPEVLIEVSDANTPCLIKPVLEDEKGKRDYQYLVMPIKQ